MLLNNQTALITGAATGIGEAVARLFASEGARIFLLDRDAGRNRSVTESIRSAGGWAQDFACDVRHAAEIAPAVDSAIQQFGQIDILINNAGIYPRQPFLGMAEQQWDEMQAVNLKSMYHCLQLVLPHMVARRAGNVVNISSVTFHLGMGNMTHYVASKGGVIGLTRSLAREMGEHNIHINCITPGAIKTEAEARFVTDEQAKEFVSRQSLQRRLMPLDVARVCLFLSSELSDGMTGQCLNVDGGWAMY
ncbi:MAG TPA: SDR family NAD(P)-dependent oxidoreductase [Bryobacteraceae bacterium]|jgi:3-oxoacyl-[acyl-carrier protein] reductase|nr:SDR family NAD(P)-dependent oxidoreductase [Bryobacteraceae bacterium]